MTAQVSVRWSRPWSRATRTVVVAVLAVQLLAPPPATGQTSTDWPQFQGTARHAGYAADELTITSETAPQLGVIWTATLPPPGIAGPTGTVAVAAGKVYAASGSTVTAFDAASGAEVWQTPLWGDLLGTPSVEDGLVLVGMNEGTGSKGFVVALDALTGALVWKRSVGRLPGGSLSASTSITTTSSRAFVSLADGSIVALSVRKGRVLWQSAVLPGCAFGSSAPSVAHGLVVAGRGGSDVSALDVDDGSLVWHASLTTGCGTSNEAWLPAIRQFTVYTGLLDGVAALNLLDGKVLWYNKTDVTEVFFPLSVTADAVIAGPKGGNSLAALHRADGSVAWRSGHAGQVAGTSTFGSLVWGMLGTGVPDGGIVAFSRRTGREVFFRPSNVEQGMPPVVSGGRVFANLGHEVVSLALG